ncbi:hypothetical protein BpHYR1_008265 [Brachionus plicatilis]|uniref:Uncharacterized protein n=1 Tax=Brachionus plicatilis TaxID=10195 RepID=A0A3M7ST57_BRAPC|nr:hypothetical protein BpHYR1_008265 [Brachionus plicatilis]
MINFHINFNDHNHTFLIIVMNAKSQIKFSFAKSSGDWRNSTIRSAWSLLVPCLSTPNISHRSLTLFLDRELMKSRLNKFYISNSNLDNRIDKINYNHYTIIFENQATNCYLLICFQLKRQNIFFSSIKNKKWGSVKAHSTKSNLHQLKKYLTFELLNNIAQKFSLELSRSGLGLDLRLVTFKQLWSRL